MGQRWCLCCSSILYVHAPSGHFRALLLTWDVQQSVHTSNLVCVYSALLFRLNSVFTPAKCCIGSRVYPCCSRCLPPRHIWLLHFLCWTRTSSLSTGGWKDCQKDQLAVVQSWAEMSVWLSEMIILWPGTIFWQITAHLFFVHCLCKNMAVPGTHLEMTKSHQCPSLWSPCLGSRVHRWPEETLSSKEKENV